MASRIIFELDDQGSIINVIHEASSPPPNAPLPTGDEAALARRLLRSCSVVDIETTLRQYSCERIISVACYGLWKLRKKQVRASNPSGLVLTVLRRGSEVPDVVDEILREIRRPPTPTEQGMREADFGPSGVFSSQERIRPTTIAFRQLRNGPAGTILVQGLFLLERNA